MENNYFQGNNSHPSHLSVGAVLINGQGKVCCHHFLTKDLVGYWNEEGLDDFYILMRETPNPNETLESALYRGLMEEFGVTGQIIDYLGSIKSHFKHKGVEVEKTTVYFLCKLESQDELKRGKDDIEHKSKIEWHEPEFLIPIMKKQAEKFGRTDVDESEILERIQNGLV